MISMKIECMNEKVIVYLYKYRLSFDDTDKLNQEIKNIFIRLIKKYHFNFFGYSIVNVYENKKYGCVLEIEQIYNNGFNIEIIDLKLIVHRNCNFYLEFNDYFFFLPHDLLIKNNKYYMNINNIDNLLKYSEFGKLIYNEKEVLNL